jgi:hypothetical protein
VIADHCEICCPDIADLIYNLISESDFDGD